MVKRLPLQKSQAKTIAETIRQLNKIKFAEIAKTIAETRCKTIGPTSQNRDRT